MIVPTQRCWECDDALRDRRACPLERRRPSASSVTQGPCTCPAWPFISADVRWSIAELLELAGQIDRDPDAAAERLPYDLFALADRARRLRAQATEEWHDWAHPKRKAP